MPPKRSYERAVREGRRTGNEGMSGSGALGQVSMCVPVSCDQMFKERICLFWRLGIASRPDGRHLCIWEHYRAFISQILTAACPCSLSNPTAGEAHRALQKRADYLARHVCL